MFVQHLEVTVLGGHEAAFEAALCEVRQRVFMCRGFRGFLVAQGAERPSSYFVDVRWETPEELADGVDHGLFERCWAPVAPFLDRPLRAVYLVERESLALHGPGVITDQTWLAD